MTTRQATCEERIEGQLIGRLADMREWLEDYASDADADCANLDSDGDIDRVDYVFQDWYDGARVTLDVRQQHEISLWLDHIWMKERE